LAGFFATAVAFGPARNGYGLFLPDIRREFGFSVEMADFVASASYVGYLVALSVVGLFAARIGPRLMVVTGGLSPGVGMALVAFAPNAVALAVGMVLAATNAGWSWAPYNNAVDRAVPPRLRDRVLSIVSTGTTFGIMVAGLTALATGAWGLHWRAAWLGFALAAFAVAAYNAWLLPGGPHGSGGRGEMRLSYWGWFAREGSAPLFVVALSFGVVNAAYWSFAVDLLSRSGGSYGPYGPSWAVGPVLYAVLGIAGFTGLFTGDAVARFGLRWVLLAIQVSLGISVGLLGLASTSLLTVVVSAVLFGVGVMTMSALLSVWSSAVFPEQPSTGFSAALFLFAIGNVVGPAALGTFAGSFGLEVAFLLTGALALLTALVRSAGGLRPVTAGSSPEGSSDRAPER
jgi:predicted MFS family arabinose efflux permease